MATNTKSGFLTSEFALTALLIVCVTILISFDKLSIDSLVSLWPLFTSASAYSISRGLAKGKDRSPVVIETVVAAPVAEPAPLIMYGSADTSKQ